MVGWNRYATELGTYHASPLRVKGAQQLAIEFQPWGRFRQTWTTMTKRGTSTNAALSPSVLSFRRIREKTENGKRKLTRTGNPLGILLTAHLPFALEGGKGGRGTALGNRCWMEWDTEGRFMVQVLGEHSSLLDARPQNVTGKRRIGHRRYSTRTSERHWLEELPSPAKRRVLVEHTDGRDMCLIHERTGSK